MAQAKQFIQHLRRTIKWKDVAELNQPWWFIQTPNRILRHSPKLSEHLFYIESNSVTHDEVTRLGNFGGQLLRADLSS